jgi:anaerobic magnesium-protoporphyrin IX monomethyl ester cyclase
MFKALVTNPPWPGDGYGARASVRWPHKRKDKKLEYPIFLSYAVALTRAAGVETTFLDGVCDELGIEDYGAEVARLAPDFVAMECSTPSIDHDLLSVRRIKEHRPGTFVALMGSHATYFHRQLLEENPHVDAIIRGEFEITVREVALALKNGTPLTEVGGLTFRDGGTIQVTPDRPFDMDLDTWPLPARDIVPIERYQTAQYQGRKGTFMLSSRGCPYRCTFCLWPGTMVGRDFRARKPESVVDEMELLVKNYGVDDIYFDDDTMTIDRERLLRICRLIQERELKVHWIAMGRVDTVDEELLTEMRKAGCDNVYLGVESGSPEILKRLKKGIQLSQVEEAFRVARRVGVKTQAFFMMGGPGETKETLRETIDFAVRLDPDNAQFAAAVPYPGTEMYEESVRKGYLKASTWEDYAARDIVLETETLSRLDLEKARLEAYRRFYLRPRFILRTALRLTSLRELRRVLRGTRSIVSRLLYFSANVRKKERGTRSGALEHARG